MSLSDRYDVSLSRVERMFEVPELLRSLFLKALDAAIKETSLNSARLKLQNQHKLLSNIRSDTMEKVKKEYYSILYEDAVIFIVSNTEQILKECFNELVVGNLDKLEIDHEFDVRLSDLKTSGFETDKFYWARRIIDEIHGARSPQEKANFQNMLAVEDLFKKYFKIEFDDKYKEISRRAHYYFQLRHILLHNAGMIDDRFVKNVRLTGSKVSQVDVGTRVDITRHQYDQCKYVFGSLLSHIDAAVSKRGLTIAG